MGIFTAIALTVIFVKLKMATTWIVWCWICEGLNILCGIIKAILSKKEDE